MKNLSQIALKTIMSTALLVSSSVLFAQQGVSGRELTIGQFAALTGPAAQLGLRMQAGIKAQFDPVNKAGGTARDQRRQSALDRPVHRRAGLARATYSPTVPRARQLL